MTVNFRYKIILFFALFTISCIEEYKPLLEVKDMGEYVVSGTITDKEGFQTVNISLTSDTEKPEFIPVNGCTVYITDDCGNSFQLDESGAGIYKAWISQEFLNAGISYKVEIITPQGDEISSDYDMMPLCAEIDSIYYLVEDKLTTNPEKPIQGIQIYSNLIGNEDDTRYYRYTVEETWEYHTKFLNYGYYDGVLHTVDPPDSSTHICWKTQFFPSIFILTTSNLEENNYSKFPLQYVSTTDEKLEYGYSIMVNQYALSEQAYFFWNKIRKNTMNEGGLYESQPGLIHGNIYNLTNSNKEVLGYFSASSVKSKRIFIENVPGLTLTTNTHCVDHLLLYGVRSLHPAEWPAYIYPGYYPVFWLNDNCVDCTGRGGKNIKPSFWPK